MKMKKRQKKIEPIKNEEKLVDELNMDSFQEPEGQSIQREDNFNQGIMDTWGENLKELVE